MLNLHLVVAFGRTLSMWFKKVSMQVKEAIIRLGGGTIRDIAEL